MRASISILIAALTFVACSGPTAEGTFLVKSASISGNCSGSNEVTWTFRRLDDGAAYALEIPSVQGGCKLSTVDGDESRLARRCSITLSDGLVPGNVTGMLDYDLVFTNDGFAGTVAVEMPPSKSAPGGCKGVNRLVGQRR